MTSVCFTSTLTTVYLNVAPLALWLMWITLLWSAGADWLDRFRHIRRAAIAVYGVDEAAQLELYSVPDRQLMQVNQSRRNMVGATQAEHQSSSCILDALYGLQRGRWQSHQHADTTRCFLARKEKLHTWPCVSMWHFWYCIIVIITMFVFNV